MNDQGELLRGGGLRSTLDWSTASLPPHCRRRARCAGTGGCSNRSFAIRQRRDPAQRQPEGEHTVERSAATSFCRNVEEATKNGGVHQAIVTALDRQLKRSDKALTSNSAYRRYLRASTGGRTFEIDPGRLALSAAPAERATIEQAGEEWIVRSGRHGLAAVLLTAYDVALPPRVQTTPQPKPDGDGWPAPLKRRGRPRRGATRA